MIGLALAACGTAGAVAVALRGLTQVRRAAPPRDPHLRRALASGDEEILARGLATAFGEHGAAIAEAVSAKAIPLAVQSLNEVLGDIDRELRLGLEFGRPAARVALAVGTLGAVLEAIGGLSGEGIVAWVFAAPAFLLGASGAGVCIEMSRRASAYAVEARTEWDRLAAELGRKLDAEPVPEAPKSPAKSAKERN